MFLFAPSRLSLLALLKHEFSVIHHPADRGFRIWCDLDEVLARVSCEFESRADCHDSNLFPTLSNNPHLGGGNLIIASYTLWFGDILLLLRSLSKSIAAVALILKGIL